MSQARINIRGTSDGVVVNIGAGDWNSLVAELTARLEQAASFFKGGRVALYIGPRQLSQDEVAHLGALFQQHAMSLWAVVGDSEETRQVVAALGLETELAVPRPSVRAGPGRVPGATQVGAAQVQLPRLADEAGGEELPAEGGAVLVRRTLRSGQTVRHTGHVVVIGDVNPGAEIIAGGDVVVWGRLRGTVHAGAGGDDDAVVCALALTPTQLRIGSHIARSPGGEPGRHILPEVASVQGDQIVAKPWGEK
jgi:septum site-determining protein MinC